MHNLGFNVFERILYMNRPGENLSQIVWHLILIFDIDCCAWKKLLSSIQKHPTFGQGYLGPQRILTRSLSVSLTSLVSLLRVANIPQRNSPDNQSFRVVLWLPLCRRISLASFNSSIARLVIIADVIAGGTPFSARFALVVVSRTDNDNVLARAFYNVLNYLLRSDLMERPIFRFL